MRRNILFGAILVLTLTSLCFVVVSCDSDAEDPALYLELKGEKVGQVETSYGWSAEIDYSSDTYNLVISDETATSYEWIKDDVLVSTDRIYGITVKYGSVDYFAYADEVLVGRVHIDTSQKSVEINMPETSKMYDGSDEHRVEVKTGEGDETVIMVLGLSSSVPDTYVWSDTAPRYWVKDWESGTGDPDNYDLSTGSSMGSVTINKLSVSIKAENQTIVYGDAIVTGTDKVSSIGLLGGHKLTAITLSAIGSEVGTGVIKPSDATIMNGSTSVTDCYDISYQNGVLTIDQRNLTITANDKTISYGDPLGTSVSTGTDQLLEGHTIDSITMSSNVSEAGEVGQITPSAATIVDEDGDSVTGNYNISYASGTLSIVQRNLTITAIDQTVEYGKFVSSVEQASCNNIVTGDQLTDIILTPSISNVGTGVIKPSNAKIMNGSREVTDNYNISLKDGEVEIIPREIELDISGTELEYDGRATRTISKGTGVYDEELNEETLKIEIHFTKSYDVGIYSYVEDPDEEGYILVGNWQSDTGTITNYNVTGTTTGDIEIKKHYVTIEAKPQTIEYGSSIATGIDEVLVEGIVKGELKEITLTPSTSDAVAGTITPSGAKIMNGTADITSNYDISYQKGVLTITQKELTITAKNQTVQYGKFVSSVEQVSCNGLISGDKLTGITLTPSTYDVGTGTITPSGAVIMNGSKDVTGNYKIIPKDGELVIQQRKITLDIGSNELTYDGHADRTIKMSTGVNDEKLRIELHFTESYDAGTHSNEEYVLGEWQSDTGKISNYEITTKTSDVTIKAYGVDITVGGETSYNGSVTHILKFDTGLNGEKLSIEAKFTSKDIGDYEFESGYTLGSWGNDLDSGGKAKNYTVNRTEDTLTISKMAIEIDVLDVGSFEYDSETVTKDVRISGANGEYVRAICKASSPNSGTYTYVEGIEPSSGHYTLSTWMDDDTGVGQIKNYIVLITTYGNLEIKKRVVTITAKDQEIEYGDDAKQGLEYVSVENLVYGHTLSSVALYALTKPHVGDYHITPSNAVIMDGSEDVTLHYKFEYKDGNLHVTKRSVNTTIPCVIVTYDADSKNKVTVDIDFESKTLNAEISFSSKDVGTYVYGSSENYYIVSDWLDGTGSASDFDVTVTEYNDITIEKKHVIMKIPACSFTYNGQNVWVTSSTTGVSDDRLTLTLTTSSPNVGTYMYGKASSYTYEWSDGTGKVSNYDIDETETKTENGVTIKKADATVRAQGSKIYDGTSLEYELAESEVIGLVSGDVFVRGSLKVASKDCGTYTESTVTVETQNGSNNYKFKQEISLTIVQRSITITSGTSSAVDGMITGALVCETISSIGGSGYVNGESLAYIFTGSQTSIGSSENTFVCEDSDTALLSNYNVTYVYGTLKIISKDDVTTKAETDSNVLSEQIQADLTACAEYNRNIGKIQLIEITTTASDLSMSAEFIRDLTVDNSAPVSISTYYGRVILTNEFAYSALSEASLFKVNIMNKEKSSSSYALEYSIVLTADEKEIHSLGTSTKITFFIDTSKVFPVNRTMKIVAVESGERYDAEYDGNTGELSFNTDHLSDYGVTMEDNVGGPSFTAVIVVIIVCAVLAIAAGILIRYLKKNFYI